MPALLPAASSLDAFREPCSSSNAPSQSEQRAQSHMLRGHCFGDPVSRAPGGCFRGTEKGSTARMICRLELLGGEAPSTPWAQCWFAEYLLRAALQAPGWAPAWAVGSCSQQISACWGRILLPSSRRLPALPLPRPLLLLDEKPQPLPAQELACFSLRSDLGGSTLHQAERAGVSVTFKKDALPQQGSPAI